MHVQEWPDNDFRIFVGDLGNEVNDDVLGKAFQRYPSFAKAKVGYEGPLADNLYILQLCFSSRPPAIYSSCQPMCVTV